MDVLTIHQNGASMAKVSQHPRTVTSRLGRGQKGWTADVARANRKFLQSVVYDDLTGVGVSYTLTVGDIPPPEEWRRLMDNLVMWFRDTGYIRHHHVVEFQKRGAPHVHGVVYYPDGDSEEIGRRLIAYWLKAARGTNPDVLGQNAQPVRTVVHWAEYLDKHATRSIQNYQRAEANLNAEWVPGRLPKMYRFSGDWPRREPEKFRLPERKAALFRALLVEYCASELERKGDPENAEKIRKRAEVNPDDPMTYGLNLWVPRSVQFDLLREVGISFADWYRHGENLRVRPDTLPADLAELSEAAVKYLSAKDGASPDIGHVYSGPKV